ncbi:MAG: hypothetical protein LBJ02_05460 [Bifidobacteriaceae bacterium]|jgi:cytochrome c biogenesis factor|nr:hypothetical protein [Bifidobacteriaceae bacterium]
MTFQVAFMLIACEAVSFGAVNTWHRWRADRSRDNLLNFGIFVCLAMTLPAHIFDHATAPQAVLAVIGVAVGVWAGLAMRTDADSTKPEPPADN